MADAARAPEVQLEALRASDSSWHPCQVSLSSPGSLLVNFESLDLEDVILNVEDLYARLRVRSLPLEGDDCQHIGEGEHLLAASKSNFKSLFFDAVVQEVRLTRHSKRIICRCTFIIKWMHQDPDSENITVPSSLVMKLSKESVQIHPVVAAFLKSMNKTSVSDGAFTTLDEPYGEYDLNGIICKQMEEIGILADGASRELLEDIIVRVKPDSSKGNIKKVAVSHSKRPLISNEGNHLRRSGRNRSKMETEEEDHEPVITSSLQESAGNIFAKEELAENRSPLNPLAARAALASLVSKIPQKLDFSFYEEERDVALESNDINRITHSAVQNDYGTLNADAEPGDLDKDMIWEGLKSRKQVSSAEKGKEVFIRKVVLASRNDTLPQCTEPNSSHKGHLLSHAVGLKKKGAFINDELVEPGDLGKDMIWEEVKSKKQLTLSAGKGEETLMHKVVLALRNDKLKQCAEPNSSRKNHILHHAMGSKKKEAFINDELAEKNKKLRISSDQKHKRNEDEGPQNENSTLNQKRSKSLKQQPSRSSPRLNVLPRTRPEARS